MNLARVTAALLLTTSTVFGIVVAKVPAPLINTISPSAIVPGVKSAQTLTILGSGFRVGSTVTFNGTALASPTVVSTNEVTVSIPAADLAKAEMAKIVVNSPTGVPSNPAFLSIADPLTTVALGIGNFAGAASPATFVSGDFNGDGIIDAAVGNNDGSIQIFLSDGKGGFTLASTIAAVTDFGQVLAMAVGDFNHDGNLDLLVEQPFSASGLSDFTVQLYFGNGAGTFTLNSNFTLGTNQQISAFCIADFDGDGNLDFCYLSGTTPTLVSFELGDGTGGFNPSNVINGNPAYVGNGATSLAIGDFNSDGLPDIAVANSTDNTVSIVLNSGSGNFSVQSQVLQVGSDPTAIITGDFNGDGYLDLVTANHSDGSTTFLPGYGNGQFGFTALDSPGASHSKAKPAETNQTPSGVDPFPPTSGTTTAMVVGDFNADGIEDVAVFDGIELSIYLGNGYGAFNYSNVLVTTDTSGLPILAAGDLNGDGHVDLIAGVPPGLGAIITAGTVGQTITFSPIPNPSIVGTSVALSASSNSGLPVTFASSTPTVCTVAGKTASLITVGTCSVVASQGGNASFPPASVTQSFSVVASAGPPAVQSLSPSSGSNASQIFTATYSDPNGVADFASERLLFNNSVSGSNACEVIYYPSSNSLYLVNNAGSQLLTPAVTPGSSTQVSNSQCTLSGTGSSYSAFGNVATLNVALSFSSTPVENIYLEATEANTSSSGWVKGGTWGASIGVPTPVSVSPSSGSGATQTFTAIYSDPNGAHDLASVRALFNSNLSATNACYVIYYPGSNSLYLASNSGTTFSTGVSPGSSAQVSNSQCTLSGAGSSYTTNGNTATLQLALTFAQTAPQNIYLLATEINGSASPWVQVGTWGVSAGAPTPVSVSPNTGSGASQTFTAVYADPNGSSDFATVRMLFNATLSGVNACYVVYNRVVNGLYLANDAGTTLSAPITPGSSATLSNSQCTLTAAGSSYTASGNNATLALELTFTGTTSQRIYLEATENNTTSSGWVQEGTWTP